MTGSRPEFYGSASVRPTSTSGSGTRQMGIANLEGAESLPGWQSLPAPMQASSASGSADDLASTANLGAATITIAEEQERSLSDQHPDGSDALLDAHAGSGGTQGVDLQISNLQQPQEVCAADDDASVRKIATNCAACASLLCVAVLMAAIACSFGRPSKRLLQRTAQPASSRHQHSVIHSRVVSR